MRRGALSRRALHGHRGRAASKVRRAPPHSPRRVRTSLAPARPLAPTVAARRAGESDHFRARGRHSVFGLSRFLLTINEAKRAYTHVPSALAHARRDRIPHAKATDRGERHAPGAMIPAWPARFHFGARHSPARQGGEDSGTAHTRRCGACRVSAPGQGFRSARDSVSFCCASVRIIVLICGPPPLPRWIDPTVGLIQPLPGAIQRVD